MKSFSQWGILAAVAYALFVAYIVIAVQECAGMFCQTGILFAIFPWTIIFLNYDVPDSINSTLLFLIFIAINTFVLYSLFNFIQKLLQKRR